MDAVLIPEVPFTLEGEHGLLAYLQRIMEEKGGWPSSCNFVRWDWLGCSALVLRLLAHLQRIMRRRVGTQIVIGHGKACCAGMARCT